MSARTASSATTTLSPADARSFPALSHRCFKHLALLLVHLQVAFQLKRCHCCCSCCCCWLCFTYAKSSPRKRRLKIHKTREKDSERERGRGGKQTVQRVAMPTGRAGRVHATCHMPQIRRFMFALTCAKSDGCTNLRIYVLKIMCKMCHS